jgi:regulator of sigma E protease
MILTVVAFIVALGLLIAIHEYGHYRVAVACGVKVLRFSVGFGQTLYRWQPKGQKHGQTTEFVLGAFPLGGYVKMLDEREGPVAPEERHLAFNTQPLRSRAMIVAAGPVANLVLAVLLYASVNWLGVDEPRAIVASPALGSIAETAGFKGGEQVLATAQDGDALVAVQSFSDLRWQLMQSALAGKDLRVTVASGTNKGRQSASATRELTLPLSQLQAADADAAVLTKIGLLGPWTEPVIGDVMADGAAHRAGLLEHDLVLRLDDKPIVDGQQLRQLIRAAVQGDQARTQVWRVQRQGATVQLDVTPDVKEEGGVKVGRIGAFVGALPEFVLVRHGPIDGLSKAVERTWEVSSLTLRTMGKILIGQASLKNLSGPLSIAEYAGKSASMGLTAYLVFLAVISVSLGVLNLLPLPLLDGGHLMYYLWESVTGRSVSDLWMNRLQRVGVGLLATMMSIAMFNDVMRLFG